MWKIILGIAGIGVVGFGYVLYSAFGAFLPWREHREVERIGAAAGVRSGQHVAEIGAGSGRFAEALARLVGPSGRVWATDLSPERLEDLRARARRLPNLTVTPGRPDDAALPGSCCDVILMRAMFHHVRSPATFASSVVKSLRPGGRLVVIDFEPGALWLHGDGTAGVPGRPGHGISQAAVADWFRAEGLVLEQFDAHWSGPLWMSLFVRPNDSGA